MKNPGIKIVSREELRILRDESGNVIETISERESQALDKVNEEIEHYSITPTTFNERVFEENVDNLLFTDKYSFQEVEVLRFGINTASMQIAASIDEDGIRQVDETSRAASTVKSAGYRVQDAATVQLTSLEKTLLNKAISYLIESNARTVLIDIFARVNGGVSNGAVKIKDGVPEIHTVVLYKNPPVKAIDISETTSVGTEANATTFVATQNVQILVIDPSNFLFSSHLSNFNIQKVQATEGSVLTNCVVKTIHKSLQIYKLAGAIGPKPDQYRDCVDLATKIAFGLNQMIEWIMLWEIKHIERCPIIQNISNSPEIDRSILEPKLANRIKQKSCTKTSENFNAIEKLIKINHDIIFNILPEEEFNRIQKECIAIFKQTDDDTIIKALCKHNAQSIEQIRAFCEHLHTTHEQLLGKIFGFDIGELV